MTQPEPIEENPYEPPREPDLREEEVFLYPVGEDPPETLRSNYLAQEASIRTIGLYLYLQAAIGVCTTILVLASPRFFQQIVIRANPQGAMPVVFLKAVMVFSGLFGVAINFFLGFFLQKLHDWARWLMVVAAAFGVLGGIMGVAIVGSRFNLDALIMLFSVIFNIYILILLLSHKTSIVMSDRYRQAVLRTPQLAPRPGPRDLCFLGLATICYLGSVLFQVYRALA